MPIINGKGAREVSSLIFNEGGAIIDVTDAYGNCYAINVGLHYKHLGSYKDAKRNKNKELSYRAGEAGSASTELFKALSQSYCCSRQVVETCYFLVRLPSLFRHPYRCFHL